MGKITEKARQPLVKTHGYLTQHLRSFYIVLTTDETHAEAAAVLQC
jgi:hypothetical protein